MSWEKEENKEDREAIMVTWEKNVKEKGNMVI